MVYSLADIVMLRQMLDASPGAKTSRQSCPVPQDGSDARLLRDPLAADGRCSSGTLERPAETCGNCDTCLGNVEVVDGTLLTQRHSPAPGTGQMFRVNVTVDVLVGRTRHAYGPLATTAADIRHRRELSAREWRSVYRRVAAGLMVDMEKKGGCVIRANATPCCGRKGGVRAPQGSHSPSARTTGRDPQGAPGQGHKRRSWWPCGGASPLTPTSGSVSAHCEENAELLSPRVTPYFTTTPQRDGDTPAADTGGDAGHLRSRPGKTGKVRESFSKP